MKKYNLTITLLSCSFIFFFNWSTCSQCLILGADLSYTNAVEANGGSYMDGNGNPVDPYVYFAEQGGDMVRIRLWHTPENITDDCGQPISTNNLKDAIMAFQRAKAAGMQLNLAIHYGDYFNDPGKQKMPNAWMGLSHTVLLDSIYQYTYKVLDQLFAKNILPDIVAIGNETTWGFVDATETTDGWQWPQDADKFNAGLKAVDDFNADYNAFIKKAVHFTDKTAVWLTGLFKEQGITNYDIIGLSFYPVWTEFQHVEEFGAMISQLKSVHNKEVMVFETGAIWTASSGDNYNNIFDGYGPLSYPVSPQGQRDFLFDLANTVLQNGGLGVLYWEPAWVVSALCDKWGQGSSYENASFFNFNNNNTPLPAFEFFDFCNTINSIEETYHLQVNIFPNPNNRRGMNIKSEVLLSSWHLLAMNGQVLQKGIFEKADSLYQIYFSDTIQNTCILTIQTEAGKNFSRIVNFSD